VQWIDLYTSRVSLGDVAMCMNLINESLFNLVIFVIFGVIVNHVVIVIFYFLVIANTTAFYVPDWRFSEGVIRLNWVAKWAAAWNRLKTTDLHHNMTSYLYSISIYP